MKTNFGSEPYLSSWDFNGNFIEIEETFKKLLAIIEGQRIAIRLINEGGKQ